MGSPLESNHPPKGASIRMSAPYVWATRTPSRRRRSEMGAVFLSSMAPYLNILTSVRSFPGEPPRRLLDKCFIPSARVVPKTEMNIFVRNGDPIVSGLQLAYVDSSSIEIGIRFAGSQLADGQVHRWCFEAGRTGERRP